MKKTAVILSILSLLLYSCNQHNPSGQIPVLGQDIDSAAIAADTLGQKSLESSYEYAHTLIVNSKLAYDVRAYDGPPSHGKYCIIRRGADNKPDTVVEGERFGIILNTFTADLNSNGREEIYIVMRKTDIARSGYVVGYEYFPANEIGAKTYKPLDFGNPGKTFTINTPVPYDSINPGHDTIFVRNNLLLKTYPPDKKYAAGNLNHAWKLEGNKFRIVPND